MKQKTILSELKAYQQGKQTHEIKKEYGLSKIVKLASNENVYGYSPKVKEEIQNHFPELNIYPDGHTGKLRRLLSEKLHVPEEQLLFGSGSEEIVTMICRAFLSPGKNTVMAANTFPQYKHNSLVEGGEVREIPVTDKGEHDLIKMQEAIDEDTTVVWICAPDNPTGTLVSEHDLLTFMKKCPSDVLIVLDEAYREFVDDHYSLDTFTYLKDYPNLISLRTFSKAYGLAGLRIGYGIGHKNVIHHLNVVRGPFNTTSLAQQAAYTAFQDQEFIRKTKEENEKVKQSFYQFLDLIGWHYYPTQTNFIYVSTPVSGMDVFQYLIEHGFIIRPGELLGYPNSIRISLGKKEDMDELQLILQKFHEQNG